MAIIGATIKDKAVAKFTKTPKSPALSYFQIIKKEPTIKIIIFKLYNLLFLVRLGNNNSKVLLSALPYPSKYCNTGSKHYRKSAGCNYYITPLTKNICI